MEYPPPIIATMECIKPRHQKESQSPGGIDCTTEKDTFEKHLRQEPPNMDNPSRLHCQWISIIFKSMGTNLNYIVESRHNLNNMVSARRTTSLNDLAEGRKQTPSFQRYVRHPPKTSEPLGNRWYHLYQNRFPNNIAEGSRIRTIHLVKIKNQWSDDSCTRWRV